MGNCSRLRLGLHPLELTALMDLEDLIATDKVARARTDSGLPGWQEKGGSSCRSAQQGEWPYEDVHDHIGS